jgi:hypothetical protein
MRSRAQQIAIKCSKAGCDEDKARIHTELFVKKGWDPHPPEDFEKWWNPRDTEDESGASVGGHPDAFRLFARKDPGRWVRQSFGTTADIAWNIALYREEYDAWVAAGKPQPDEEYVSIALSREEQQKRFAVIAAVVGL